MDCASCGNERSARQINPTGFQHLTGPDKISECERNEVIGRRDRRNDKNGDRNGFGVQLILKPAATFISAGELEDLFNHAVCLSGMQMTPNNRRRVAAIKRQSARDSQSEGWRNVDW